MSRRKDEEVFNIEELPAEVLAYKIGVKPDEIQKLKGEGVNTFNRTSILAVKGHMTYHEAAEVLNELAEGNKVLQPRISNYHNSRAPNALYPKEPRPKTKTENKSIYDNPHKKKSTAGWRVRSAEEITFRARQNAVNTEQETPLDEEANPFD
jgi:hypothetical protein